MTNGNKLTDSDLPIPFPKETKNLLSGAKRWEAQPRTVAQGFVLFGHPGFLVLGALDFVFLGMLSPWNSYTMVSYTVVWV